MSAFLYDSFTNTATGGRYSDNPKYVFEELRLRRPEAKHVFSGTAVNEFPAAVEVFDPRDPAAMPSLDTYDSIVTNTYTPWLEPKPAGMFLLQTWHGTPLKRLALDNPSNDDEMRERLRVDINKWDALVSPNAFSTAAFRSAFGFEGDIWETGYPRNDPLSRSSNSRTGAEARRRLGIEEDKIVVLYAPTWRDNLITSDGRKGFDLKLDVDRLAKALGDSYVVLLRLHYYISDRAAVSVDNVIDVSDAADINELYLAADVLVTDYSSAMFDFAITGKPMVFYTYDLEQYRDEVRGFYFDFETEAPGPLMTTNDDVLAALQALEGVEALYGEAYRAFTAKFCYLDDGRASERVANRLLASIEH